MHEAKLGIRDLLRTRGGLLKAAIVLIVVFAATLAAVRWLQYPDADVPTITSVFPPAGKTDVFGDTRLVIGFDRPFPGALDAVSLRLRNADDQRITGAFEVHTSQTAAMMIPNSELVPGTYNAEARIGQGEAVEWEFTVSDNQIPEPGLGGPILVIGSDSVVFDDFYAEILRAEGLTSFTTTEAANLTRDILFSHQVAILAEPVLDNALMPIIEDWLERGGNLIAVRPSGELAALSGLMPASSTLDDAYLRIDTSAPPGQGLVGETIQFHGTADIVSTTPDIRTIATLFSDATSSAIAPALTIRPIGTAGGEIAAFTFDLARSVVLLGQGNLEWAGQERDGLDPIRPNDLFFGGTGDNAEPDFVDLNKVAIPQADEQMRMLSNLITHMMRDTAPLPRFWYFPKGAKALLVMAADDHGTRDRTNQSFDRMLVLGPENCDVANWECARATSWMERSSGMSDRQAAGYVDQGFDIGGHASTHCHDWSGYTLTRAFFEDLLDFRLVFPSVPPQQGSRFHCIVWSDYASQPHIERGWGIRYDMNYYYWPKDWIDGRAGFMTGSGLPMRFSDEQGRLIDVYQQETHLVDEVFSSSFEAVEALIDRALGPEAYCGAFGTHYDFHNPFDVQLMDLATDRGVPLVSAQQMLDWTDGRNGSNFGDVRWEESTLSFAVRTDPRTGRMLEGMLPLQFSGETLQEIRREGEAIAFRSETIKGIGYGFFDAVTGAYTATYLQR